MNFAVMFAIAVHLGLTLAAMSAQSLEPSIRAAAVQPSPTQPQQQDQAVLFYDDFDESRDLRAAYFDYHSDKDSFIWTKDQGLGGGAMRCQFEKGQVSPGGLQVIFGRNPVGKSLRSEETFREIYWRVYVKHEPGWEGNPAKLGRTTCLAGREWSQGFIGHVWGGRGDVLCIDPATGIRDNQKVTTRYNDFAKLRWLGIRQGQTPIFSPAESGRWVCVESHVRLNTPGQRDGVFELSVDGKVEASRTDLDWHGTWSEYGINAVFLENYWNRGAIKREARWFDNFVISTNPIGPITAARPATITRTASSANLPWEAQIATDPEGKDIVWTSTTAVAADQNLAVNSGHGKFTGSCEGEETLGAGPTYWVQVRETGKSQWSPWHMPFR